MKESNRVIALIPDALRIAWEKKHLRDSTIFQDYKDWKRADSELETYSSRRYTSYPVLALLMIVAFGAASAIAMNTAYSVSYFTVLVALCFILGIKVGHRLNETRYGLEKAMKVSRERIESFQKDLAKLDPSSGGCLFPEMMKSSLISEQLVVFASNILEAQERYDKTRLDLAGSSRVIVRLRDEELESAEKEFNELFAACEELEVFSPHIPKKWFFGRAKNMSN